VAPTNPTAVLGINQAFVATAIYDDSSTGTVTGSATWTSSDTQWPASGPAAAARAWPRRSSRFDHHHRNLPGRVGDHAAHGERLEADFDCHYAVASERVVKELSSSPPPALGPTIRPRHHHQRDLAVVQRRHGDSCKRCWLARALHCGQRRPGQVTAEFQGVTAPWPAP